MFLYFSWMYWSSVRKMTQGYDLENSWQPFCLSSSVDQSILVFCKQHYYIPDNSTICWSWLVLVSTTPGPLKYMLYLWRNCSDYYYLKSITYFPAKHRLTKYPHNKTTPNPRNILLHPLRGKSRHLWWPLYMHCSLIHFESHVSESALGNNWEGILLGLSVLILVT